MISKQIFRGILIISLLVCVASAGTWAYFDSSVPVNGNKITAGTMNLDVINLFYNNPPALVPMVAVGAIPGADNVRLTPIPTYASNAGSIDGMLSLKIVPDAGDDGILSKYVVIKATTSPTGGNMVTLWDGTSTGSTGIQELCNLNHGTGQYIYYVYSFPNANQRQNDAQGKTFKFDVEYSLKQI